ncbi:Detected protein of confused Function [Hibiscus syriacus]|uniref:Detected protein of confused Function n=1 Tax=Hibiscus syriacus TaxID=106335 RepID=A0A6A3AKN5_HIBSY|nr:Detected protein of confused Function [Hibiscus syriacus]
MKIRYKLLFFLSPKFVLGPGSVENRFYYNVDFPKGHIAVKSFNAEVVEAGHPVPLHETYLHHWVVGRYFVRKGVEISEFDHHAKLNSSDYISGRNIMCSSLPTYGEGEEPGNEAGYIVRMTTCYPQPGAIEISKGETLMLESNYSSIRHHTGVMGLLYIMVADQLPKPMHTLRTVIQTQDTIALLTILWAVVAMIGAVAVIAVAIHYRLKSEGDGYEAIGM